MPNNGNEQLFTEGESLGINFLILNDLKKRGNENTSPTPVNRSLRDINNNRFQSLILVQTLEQGTQKSSNSNGNTTSVILNQESKLEAVPFQNGRLERICMWVERKEKWE